MLGRKLRSELGSKLALLLASTLLGLELELLLLTTVGALSNGKTDSLETELGLELLGGLLRLIDQSETTGASSTKLRLEAEDRDATRVLNLVHRGDLISDLLP